MNKDLKKSVFFPGGEVVYPSVLADDDGLQFTPNKDNTWTITLKVSVTEDEAQGIIQRYQDFDKIEANADFEEINANWVYVKAFEDDTATKPLLINLDTVKLSIINSHKSEADGQIIFSLVPTDGVGKTKNGGGKTKNAGAGLDPQPAPEK